MMKSCFSVYLVSLEGQVLSEEGERCSVEAAMYLSLLVCAKAAGRKSLPRIGRQWPASGAPAEEENRK